MEGLIEKGEGRFFERKKDVCFGTKYCLADIDGRFGRRHKYRNRFCCGFDLDGNGFINLDDLLALVNRWL